SPLAPPPPETGRAVAALCAAHPGPAPVLVEWMEEENGHGTIPGLAPGVSAHTARLRSRSLRVAVDDELLGALRELLGPDRVHRLRGAARRPAVPRRPGDGRGMGAARRHERHGHRAPEGS